MHDEKFAYIAKWCRNSPRHVDFCNDPLKFHIIDSCAVETRAIEYGVLTCNILHAIRYA
jgi:hypothetical protein